MTLTKYYTLFSCKGTSPLVHFDQQSLVPSARHLEIRLNQLCAASAGLWQQHLEDPPNKRQWKPVWELHSLGNHPTNDYLKVLFHLHFPGSNCTGNPATTGHRILFISRLEIPSKPSSKHLPTNSASTVGSSVSYRKIGQLQRQQQWKLPHPPVHHCTSRWFSKSLALSQDMGNPKKYISLWKSFQMRLVIHPFCPPFEGRQLASDDPCIDGTFEGLVVVDNPTTEGLMVSIDSFSFWIWMWCQMNLNYSKLTHFKFK